MARHRDVDDTLGEPSRHTDLPPEPRTPPDDAVDLPVEAIKPAESPRADGEDAAHIRVLAETEAHLPPILVHRDTMRVIDGMHRLQAAKLKGARTIRACFFDGEDEAAFVLAVSCNIAHGLPLSLADRKAACRRILASYPQWSDRKIADTTGLTHKTVGALRRQSSDPALRAVSRVGLDGRVRPLTSSEGRLRASEMLTENPAASAEEVSAAAGISLTTVKDVRRRLNRGLDPVPCREQPTPSAPAERPAPTPMQPQSRSARRVQPAGMPQDMDRASILQRLRADPSLRLAESGRALLRWLDAGPRTLEDSAELADRTPEHLLVLISGLARQNAVMWQQLATHLERRASEGLRHDSRR